MKLLLWVLPIFFICGCYKNPPEDHLDEMPAASNTSMIKKEDGDSKNEMQMPGMGMPQQPSME